jgi:aminoglycoside phosphotransferase (APT) family kinase protein
VTPAAEAGRNALLDTSWRPDTADLAARLAQWVEQRFPAGHRLGAAAFPSEGGSSLNLQFGVEHPDGPPQRFVARLASPGPQYAIFPDENLEREARYMRVVREHSDVPVPEVQFVEDDPSWLGTPFLVLPHLPGRPWPSDPPYNFAGWVLEASPAQRRRMQRQLVTVLAGIHQVDERRVDLRGFARPELGDTALEAQVNYLCRFYDWGRDGVRYPLVESALAYLSATVPARPEPACVTWGDARTGNLLFAGERVSAVLDWEGAALGYPEVDLAFGCLMHRYYQQRAEAQGFPGLPEAFRPADMAAEYAEVSGRRVADLGWYELLGAARAAVIQVRFVTRASLASGAPTHQSTLDPDAALSIRPLLRELLDCTPI